MAPDSHRWSDRDRHTNDRGARRQRSSDDGSRFKKDKSIASFGGPLLIVLPWTMFFTVLMILSFAFHHWMAIAITLVVTWVLLAIFYILLSAQGRMAGSWYRFLGALCLLGCGSGVAAGTINYQAHMYAYWAYAEGRTYTNLLPSQPAAAHLDAGKVIFTRSSRIDTTRAFGFKSGSTYCVAPILDDVNPQRVEYWAAGIDCCPMRGDFNCDDAWDPKARGGVMVLDPMGFMPGPSKHDMYLKAIKAASASFSLTPAPEPMLVRWVADPQAFQDDAWRSGIGFIVASACVYGLLSLMWGVIAHMWSRRSAMAEGANTD